jgi:2,4-dienoyl-CoA reductase (NADPH2)
MKAACTAAQRGHKVTLIEKQDALGGQLLLNRLIPGREELVTAATDLANNLDALNVEVMLNREADASLIKEISPDAVVIASGAKPIVPDIPGIDNPNVVQAWDLLAEKETAGNKVVIIGGNAVGLETALYLSSQGTLSAEVLHFLMINRAESIETLTELLNSGDRDVTVVEMTKKVGQDIGASTRWTVMAELGRLGVTIHKKATAVGITAEGLKIEKHGKTELLAADTIVMAVGSTPDNALANEVESLVPDVHLVGDAKEPRNALDGVREGFLAGLRI